MLESMYGSLKIKNKIDIFLFPIKIIYMVYTIPFLLFVLLMQIRTLGAFGNAFKEKVGKVKALLIHFSAIFLSFIFWGVIINFILGKYNL